MAERVTVRIRCQRHVHALSNLVGLFKNGPTQLAYAIDGLREDDSVEAQVEVFGGSCLGRVGGAISGLYDSLVGHRALLVEAVHEWTGCDYLSLRSFSRCLPLFIHCVHVVQ